MNLNNTAPLLELKAMPSFFHDPCSAIMVPGVKGIFIRLKKINFISYLYEWCFSQLKDAAQLPRNASAMAQYIIVLNQVFVKLKLEFIMERFAESTLWEKLGLPYIYDKTCQYVSSSNDKLSDYFAQMQGSQPLMQVVLNKLLKNSGAKNSTIIIQGDHGVRLLENNIKDKDFLTSKNLSRTYNTFFVVKSPHLQFGYSEEIMPIDFLLKKIIEKKDPPILSEKKQSVYVRLYKAFDLGKSKIYFLK